MGRTPHPSRLSTIQFITVSTRSGNCGLEGLWVPPVSCNHIIISAPFAITRLVSMRCKSVIRTIEGTLRIHATMIASAVRTVYIKSPSLVLHLIFRAAPSLPHHQCRLNELESRHLEVSKHCMLQGARRVQSVAGSR